MKLIDIRPSSNKTKKYDAVFEISPNKLRKVSFGGKNYGDYIKYSLDDHRLADEKRKAYITRHKVNEDWSDPMKPGTLSRYILWEYRTLPEAIRKYKSRFNL